MKRFILIVGLLSSISFGETIKETRQGESINFYTNNGAGPTKVGEIPAVGGLKVNSVTSLSSGAVTFPNGISVTTGLVIPNESITDANISTLTQISGTKLAPATSISAGAVSTSPQTFAGDKTFSGAVNVSGAIHADTITNAVGTGIPAFPLTPASQPPSPTINQVYYDATLNAYRKWNGTVWTTITATGSLLTDGTTSYWGNQIPVSAAPIKYGQSFDYTGQVTINSPYTAYKDVSNSFSTPSLTAGIAYKIYYYAAELNTDNTATARVFNIKLLIDGVDSSIIQMSIPYYGGGGTRPSWLMFPACFEGTYTPTTTGTHVFKIQAQGVSPFSTAGYGTYENALTTYVKSDFNRVYGLSAYSDLLGDAHNSRSCTGSAYIIGTGWTP